jgi:hypothetical protein
LLLLQEISGPDLQGEAELTFDPEGVVWTCEFPLRAEQKTGAKP